ncbi:GNAT family N-acetyltransferase [Hyunsoonleella sp. SJ7]|uniref:GNAT family N-acetyltransferase n=1 Tax=Hyunsoonleella aquatilis TaxID=2762758 RepID=A0A923HAA9_9FLAO|nr:GNAT family N-acetyltransferase [Hyunsoonleella aquatilis]MBC3757286.1 GNAT family N-acetyltransferase [Hyunsoonleella aquatilis]
MTHFQNTLQNPVWHSLNETHQKFAVSYDEVAFYDPEICPFGGFTDATKTAEALTAYSKLTDSFFLVSEKDVPSYDETFVVLNQKMEGCQMVLKELIEVEMTETIVPLTEAHIEDIYGLIWLVMPGYYKKRTFDMGEYYGIFKNDKLVATSGQRMQTDDFIEVSGVVTHPDYTRRGFAKQLTVHATKEILKTGKHPILHTTKGNPAIGLYESLGFELTQEMNWWYFNRK